MKRSVTMRWFAAVVVVVAVLAGSAYAGKPPERPSETLTIMDIDGTETVLTLADLEAMPQTTAKDYPCIGESVGFIGISDFTGVLVTTLLEKAKKIEGSSDYLKRNVYVLFKGTDGYQVMTTWYDLTTESGRQAMVALKQDGQALAPEIGEFRSVFPAEIRVARSVMCLERIELHVIPGVVEKKKDDGEKKAG